MTDDAQPSLVGTISLAPAAGPPEPTAHLRWNGGVLEQRWDSLGAVYDRGGRGTWEPIYSEWRPVPVVFQSLHTPLGPELE